MIAMPNWALYLLLLTAIAIGFTLGKFYRRPLKNRSDSVIDSRYFKGLNHLLNEQPDSAVETFIETLEVNVDTLKTHLALGNFLRRKGEVDRAIRIHQNLLARPNLTIEQSHQAQYELAADFLKAGLFDRAERLLKELVENDGHYRINGLIHLLEVYRDEHEWQYGLDVISKLSGSRFSKQYEKWAPIRAHFCCELAEASIVSSGADNSKYLFARKWLKKALSYDKQSVRASLLLGKLEIDAGYYSQGINQLQKISHQNPNYFSEALPSLLSGYKHLNDMRGYREFLWALNGRYPSNSSLLAIADLINEKEGEHAAAEFMAKEIKKNPSIIGLDRLLHFYIACTEGKVCDYFQLIKTVISRVVEQKERYICRYCGFKGKELHWLCPSCKQWRIERFKNDPDQGHKLQQL